MRKSVTVNRAPVLTLWAAVVARRLGFDAKESLTLGRAVAGLNAQSKGRRLGIFKPGRDSTKKRKSELTDGSRLRIDLLGRAVPAVHTKEGIRATSGGRPVDPESVEHYLEDKFGGALKDTRAAMSALAKSLPPAYLADQAYDLYTDFRPAIPGGKRGWGTKGRLDIERVRRMAEG